MNNVLSHSKKVILGTFVAALLMTLVPASTAQDLYLGKSWVQSPWRHFELLKNGEQQDYFRILANTTLVPELVDGQVYLWGYWHQGPWQHWVLYKNNQLIRSFAVATPLEFGSIVNDNLYCHSVDTNSPWVYLKTYRNGTLIDSFRVSPHYLWNVKLANGSIYHATLQQQGIFYQVKVYKNNDLIQAFQTLPGVQPFFSAADERLYTYRTYVDSPFYVLELYDNGVLQHVLQFDHLVTPANVVNGDIYLYNVEPQGPGWRWSYYRNETLLDAFNLYEDFNFITIE